MPTHKISYSLNRGVGSNISVQSSETNESEIAFSVSCPSPSTNKEISIAFALATVKSIFIKASGPVTLETNDGSTPDDTFSLDADKPLVWNTKSGGANPFSEDVGALFATVAGGGDAVVVEGYILTDVTP